MYPVFPLLSASTAAGLGSFPGEMTKNSHHAAAPGTFMKQIMSLSVQGSMVALPEWGVWKACMAQLKDTNEWH